MTARKRNYKQTLAGVTFLHDAALCCEVVLASGDAIAYPTHCHMANFVVGLVRSGRVRLVREGMVDCLAAGEVFVIPPHQAHSLSTTETYALLSLCVDASRVNTESIRSIGHALRRLVWSGTISGEECAAFTNALRQIAVRGRQARAQKADDPLDALRTALAAVPGRNASLARLASAVHLCPRHFSRIFRSRYGLAPHCYQRQSRLRQARMELAAGKLSQAQTALRLGFFDQSHFIREFKKLYRMTPAEYLRARREFPVSKGQA